MLPVLMRPAALDAFLDRATRTPFAYGTDDCCLWLADWLVALGQPDPAAHLRGRYRTALGCARVLRREGGVAAVVQACAETAGLARTYAPLAGDVGVVLAATDRGEHLVGALCVGRRWAMRGEGLVVAVAPMICAWSVPCPR